MGPASDARVAPGAVTQEISDLLYRECALLEEGKFEEWVELFTPDCLYWVPSNSFDGDPQRDVSIVNDDAARLRERVSRLKSGQFWAQDPPSRTTRMIGNMRLAEPPADGARGDVRVESRLVVVELRRGVSRLYSGKVLHDLRGVKGQWRIRQKVVYLIQNNEPIQNLTFLV